jgi:hypothetical protein
MRLNLVQLAMVFFFVLGALWFGGSMMGLWGFSIAGQGATAPTITGTGACSPETPPNLVIKTKYLDASTNTYSLIDTNYYYTVGDETTTTEGTTSGGVATVEAIASCGDVASLWAGDDSTYYLAEVGKITLNQNVKRVEVVLKPIGNVAITLSNSTALGASSVGVDLTAGVMNSDVKVKLKETAGSAYWGDSKHLISVAGSSYNYTKFAIVGTNVKEVACPQTHLSYYASVLESPIVKCFEVNDDLYNTKEEEFTLQIYPVAGIEPDTSISIGTADYACQIVNAKTVCGYTDYINSNVDIGASDVFVDDAVVPY